MLQVYAAGSVKDLISQKYKWLKFLQGWSDCVENLTRQRHDRNQTENQQNAATVDSCFELVGSRQHGVAQQKEKVEQPTQVEMSTKCTGTRMVWRDQRRKATIIEIFQQGSKCLIESPCFHIVSDLWMNSVICCDSYLKPHLWQPANTVRWVVSLSRRRSFGSSRNLSSSTRRGGWEGGHQESVSISLRCRLWNTTICMVAYTYRIKFSTSFPGSFLFLPRISYDRISRDRERTLQTRL